MCGQGYSALCHFYYYYYCTFLYLVYYCNARRTETYVAPRHVDASRDFFVFFFFNEQRGGRGGAGEWGALPDFLFGSLFPVQQTRSGTGHGVIK